MERCLLAALLVAGACARPPRWQPPPDAGTLVLDGDLVVRGEMDGMVSVVARVALADEQAFGFVRLRRTDARYAARSPHVIVARARAWQTLARRMAADPERASEAARVGLALLPPCAETSRSREERADERALAERIGCYVERHHEEMW